MTKRPNSKDSSASHGLQTVFRVRGTRARQKPVTNHNDLSKGAFSARKSHKKSRTGCQNCKVRRVKCDETRLGGCLRCRHHGIDCDYTSASVLEMKESTSNDNTLVFPSPTSTPSDAWSAVMTPIGTEVAVIHPPLSQPIPLTCNPPSGITSYWQTLNHFEIFTCATISSPDGQKVFESSILAIAAQKDYLMHAVLGTAAAHLAWQAELCDSPREQRRHRQAEAYHWHRAIGKFRSKLDNLQQRTTENVDALISTCMLLGIHSYFLPVNKDTTSFIWKSENERPEALQWLSLQSGFGLLLHSLGGRAALSVWLDVFNSAAVDEEAERFPNSEPIGGIYQEFQILCNIDQQSSAENNPYFTALRDLFSLLKMGPPTMINFASLMAFMGRLVGPFQDLLFKRDPKALVIVAYWLALMHQLQLWWIQERARHECTAIIKFLKQSEDARIQRMLAYPASTMNIDLSSI